MKTVKFGRGLASLGMWVALAAVPAGCKDDESVAGNDDAQTRTDLAPGTDLGTADTGTRDADVLRDAASDAELDADLDASLRDASPADAQPEDAEPVDAAPVPPFRAPTVAGDLPAPRGWKIARGLMHMHSIHSHDACDGRPKDENGIPNPVCLQRLRDALCANRYDFVMLTDHPGSFADITMEEALLIGEGDRPVFNGGDTGEPGMAGEPESEVPFANWVQCNGDRAGSSPEAEPDETHRLLLTVGSEGDLMPMMFRQKPDNAALRDRSPEGSAILKAAGAVVLQSHTEFYTAEELDVLDLDGFEIYNLHANLDPRGPLGQFTEVLPDVIEMVLAGATGPHPDLAYLAIFRPNTLALANWDTLTPRKRQLGFAASDIHENIPLAIRPADGERIDSYRRLGSWFSNYLLVSDRSFDALEQAVDAQRLFVTFDLLGAPTGFDVYLQTADGLLEMGNEADLGPLMKLYVTPPALPAGAEMEVRLYRVDAVTGTELVRSEPAGFVQDIDEAGVYRVEIWQTPNHLAAALGPDFERFIRPMVWIYANPIYIRPAPETPP
jgi:hypothetical protein